MSSGDSKESKDKEVDMKLFIKAVNYQFMALNKRFDDLKSPLRLKSSRKNMFDEKELGDSDF
ncbi:conserved hypothetical protein [Ricinus communis]|uniref:Uncharacterized protein n=1 Tax=Ricinus communis TaxID=3988 RepID=B9SIB4_RICCO|nr:conserved hypothetical protein [Ricinus communis]